MERDADPRVDRAIDRLLRETDDLLRWGGQPPTTEVERTRLRTDLRRAPIVAGLYDPLTLRGVDIDPARSVFTPSRIMTAVFLIRSGLYPPTDVVQIRDRDYVSRSLAGELYLRLLRQKTFASTVGEWAHLYLPPSLFDQDDIAAIHRGYERFLVYLAFPNLSEVERQGAVLVSDRLFDPADPNYETQLLSQLRSLKLNWQARYLNIVTALEQRPPHMGGPPTSAEHYATEAVLEIKLEAARIERERFGEGSRDAREAIDRGELSTGQLSRTCASWTYEELEHWTRWLLRSLDSGALCAIIRRRGEFVSVLGEVQMDEPCEEIDRDELIAVLDPAARTAPKRILCAILTQYTTPPPVVRWDSQRWYNLRVLADYIAPELAARLLTDPMEDDAVFPLDKGFLFAPETERYEGLDRAPEVGLRGAVAQDLYNQALAAHIHIHWSTGLTVTRRSMSLSDPPQLLASSDRHPGRGLQEWYGLLIVRGLLVVSPVSTNQVTDIRDGVLVVLAPDLGRVLPPQRLALQTGDLLIADMRIESRIEAQPPAVSENEFYDVLVLRAAEDDTVWLEFSV